MDFAGLQERLNTEKSKRLSAESTAQEKERQVSLLSVDYRQLQTQLAKVRDSRMYFACINNVTLCRDIFPPSMRGCDGHVSYTH